MREYKFRAWSKLKKHMFEVNAMSQKAVEEMRDGMSFRYARAEVVLMQPTGLFDKNGVEIHEGDIVSVPYITPMGDLTEEENWRGVVQSHFGQYVVCYVSGGAHIPVPKALTSYRKASNVEEYISNYGSYLAPTSDTILTIVGNICENPEVFK